MFIIGIIAGHIGDGMGIAKAGEGVDVTIGVVAHQVAVAQPQDIRHPKLGTQALFDPGAIETGIAGGREQAIFGGEQAAAAVDLDTAALQHHIQAVERGTAKHAAAMQITADLIVEFGVEFAAPAVEDEIQPSAKTVRGP